MRKTEPPESEVAPAAPAAPDLNTLAARVRERDERHRPGELAFVLAQAADTFAARQQCQKRGAWKTWCKEAKLSRTQAWRYVSFGKVSCTKRFAALSAEKQWARWVRFCDNAPRDKPAAAAEESAGPQLAEGGRRRRGKREPASEGQLTLGPFPVGERLELRRMLNDLAADMGFFGRAGPGKVVAFLVRQAYARRGKGRRGGAGANHATRAQRPEAPDTAAASVLEGPWSKEDSAPPAAADTPPATPDGERRPGHEQG
jgi:hypothetical protein